MLLLTFRSKFAQHRLSMCTLLAIVLRIDPIFAQDDVKTMISTIEAPQKNIESELDKLSLAQLMEKFHVPGMSIAVIKDFKLHWAKTYGVSDAKSDKALNLQTRFQSASISKPITAMAAMRLVQEGRLNLDTDVNTYFKSLRIPANPSFPNQVIHHVPCLVTVLGRQMVLVFRVMNQMRHCRQPRKFSKANHRPMSEK